MADQYRGGLPAALAPHRPPRSLPVANGSTNHYQREQQHQQQQQQPQQSSHGFPVRDSSFQPPRVSNAPPAGSSFHSRTRTTSSSVFPNSVPSPPPKQQPIQDRRFSSSTNGLPNNQPGSTMSQSQYQSYVQRSGTNNSTLSSRLRRSSSSHTSSLLSQTSYVALMRKQKATVWCDRSQTLDSRTAAQQKAAKHRAALEVHGAASSARTSTIGSSKMRSAKAGTLAPANFSGVSVPIRLSANEMLGDEEEAPDGRSIGGDVVATTAAGRGIHHRSGSGRSSVRSGTYPSGYPRSVTGIGGGGPAGRFSNGSTPPSGNEGIHTYDTEHHNANTAQPPNQSEADGQRDRDYFAKSYPTNSTDPNHRFSKNSHTNSHTNINTNTTTTTTTNNNNNNNNNNQTPSPTEEDRFGEAAELKSPPWQSAVSTAAEQAKRAEDLRRRGSVDERTMTMGGKGRLFVANPDLND